MQYPEIKDSKSIVSIDIETHDPNLIKYGPGVYRRDGKILGVSLSFEGHAEYYNIGHFDCTEGEKARNTEYIKKILASPNIKLGANLIYDVDWIENWMGLKVNGLLYDVQTAEALINENQKSYSLDTLSYKYLGIGKYKNDIDAFCEKEGLKGDPRIWLWAMPYMLVRQYAIEDARHPLKIFDKQLSILKKEELFDLFILESKCIRATLLLRKNGVLIDQKQREINAHELESQINQIKQRLYKEYGEFNYNSTQQIAELFDSLGIEYSRTEKGNPSIRNNALFANAEKHQICKDLYFIRKMFKSLSTFLHGSLVDFVTKDGRIHCSFYSTKKDNYGTRTGRFSSAKPNLQQIPSRDEDDFSFGKIARECFVPEIDHRWGSIDYSQIEYRFMAHYALGPGSKEIRQHYNDDPNTDYHKYIMDLTGLSRKPAKTLNFGVAYGMGVNKMSLTYGWDIDYCYDILNIYHSNVPFIKSTMQRVSNVAIRRGYIRTILNRRVRLTDHNFAYKMFNGLIQGSAADLMKKAMVDLLESGVYDYLTPHLTVHDELDMSIPNNDQGTKAFREAKNIMEKSIELSVPIVAKAEIGTNWSNLKEF